MKIAIKKRYVLGASILVSITLAFVMLNEVIRLLSTQSISILIVPTIFITSTVYVISYFREYAFKAKIADEAAKDVAEGDWKKEQEIKKHLLSKIDNESYSFNLAKNKPTD